jgi:putative redox protein
VVVILFDKLLITIMTHEIDTQWMGKMQFNSAIDGHTVIMDAPERVGGEDTGPIPKPFVLTALSGCTGMDVVAILRKTDKHLDELSIKVTSEISKRPPIVYTAIHVVYDMKGDIATQPLALDAVMNSQEKICGISNMLKRIMPVTWQVIYNGITIFNNQPISVITNN